MCRYNVRFLLISSVATAKKPSRRVIQCLIKKFYTTGSILDDKKGRVGAKWTTGTEKKEEARALVKENPRASLTRLQGCQHYRFFRRNTEFRKRSVFLQISIQSFDIFGFFTDFAIF